jgi:3'-phosphoadenosine 5'-phosphosulfate sulfotransferase (PAPS reductase)/FAD synthetase
MRYIAWFSCGITSAIACKLALETYGKENVDICYIHIDSAHEDNARFIQDCEKWYGREIRHIAAKEYADQFEVIAGTGYINGPTGARCTLELKKEVRKAEEKRAPFAGQVFGFEFSRKEVNRAVRFQQQNAHTLPVFPLIDAKLTKRDCADILFTAGIELPTMYKLGFHNNNCIGCVKGGKGYWQLIRKHFPETFDKMAQAERGAGHSCIKDKFLDELGPNEGRHEPPVLPDCGTFCEIKFTEIEDKSVAEIMEGKKKIVQLNLFNPAA